MQQFGSMYTCISLATITCLGSILPSIHKAYRPYKPGFSTYYSLKA